MQVTEETKDKTILKTKKSRDQKKSTNRSFSIGESKYLGLLYVAPWIIGLLVFTAYPIIASLFLSFTDYNLLEKAKGVGIQNYVNLLSDPTFIKAMKVTLKYVALEVPLKLAVSLGVAMILAKKLKAINFFRTAYYIPSILGSNVAIAVLWKFLFQSNGLINQVIQVFGGNPISWFGEATPALFTIIFLRVWEFGSTMVIFLAAIQALPKDVYEAAEVDGSSKLNSFIRITLPLLSPTIFFNLIMQLISAFQEFNAPYLITKGGPQFGTYFLPMYIYDTTFNKNKMGYASAMSWVLFIIIMVLTMITFKNSKYWVFYGDEESGKEEK